MPKKQRRNPRIVVKGETKPMLTEWDVRFASRRVEKNAQRLTPIVQDILAQLIKEIAVTGPVQPSWPNYSRLRRKRGQGAVTVRHHCHLKKGQPTYVAIWQDFGGDAIVEISYVGTHEGANREY